MTFPPIPQPDHVVLALLHTLWQASLVAAVVYVALRRVPAQHANARYGISAAGLLLVVVGALLTWCALGYIDSNATSSAEGPSPAGAEQTLGNAPAAQPEPSSLRVSRAVPPRPATATVYLLRLWFAGAVLMMFRLMWLMLGARQLRQRCRPLPDGPAASLAADVRAALGVARRVVMLVSDDVVCPVAMGLFWPAVLLPAAMATGCPPEQLRAVLAHELAHIRRYDYLVNFLQLVVESLLYFNPAVWWLSRQMRVEREACCDALAAGAAVSPADYAGALAWAARCLAGTVQPAQALGERRHELLDRARRLLLPGYRPALRLRWYTLAAGGAMSVALFVGLYQGAALGVVLAGRMLTDAQRIEILAQMSEENPSPQHVDTENETVRISCAVVPHDGQDLQDCKINVITLAGNTRIHKSWTLHDNRFSGTVVDGEIYVTAACAGYAPACIGPFRGPNLEGLELPLAPSQPIHVQFLDSRGAAVPGVELTGGYVFVEGSWSGNIRAVSDDAGLVTLDQAVPAFAISLQAEAEGFQISEQNQLLMEPGQTFEWVLLPEAPMQGVVVDKRSGAPIAGAEICAMHGGASSCECYEGDAAVVTDAAGRFSVHGLSSTRYHFLVRAEGYGKELFMYFPQQDPPARVELVPRYVQGTIHGNLDLLKRNQDGQPVISSRTPVSFRSGVTESHGSYTPVTIQDGVGTFRIEEVMAGKLHIDAGPERVTLNVTDPVENMVIRLPETEKAERRVVIKLVVPEGAPPANGRIEITLSEGTTGRYFGHYDTVEAVNGSAEFSIETPATVKFRLDNLPGYCAIPPKNLSEYFDDGGSWPIEPGVEPYIVEVPLARAGAIYGQVLSPDGSPVTDAYVGADMMLAEGQQMTTQYFSQRQVKVDAKGEFAVLTLPLDQKFLARASRGLASAQQEVALSEREPLAHVQLTLPAGMDLPVLVLQPNGQPAAGVPLEVDWPGHGSRGAETGADGAWLLRGVQPGETYTVTAAPGADFQRAGIRLALDGSENVIRLKKGLQVEGVVRMSGSGEPVPDITVGYGLNTSEYPYHTDRVRTDSQGRFRLTNLSPGQYTINVEDVLQLDNPNGHITFTASQDEPVVLHVKPAGQ